MFVYHQMKTFVKFSFSFCISLDRNSSFFPLYFQWIVCHFHVYFFLFLATVLRNPCIKIHLSLPNWHFRGHLPAAVVWPQSVQEVSHVVKICHKHRIPMIPFGTGTGLEGGVLSEQVCQHLCLFLTPKCSSTEYSLNIIMKGIQ